MTQAEFETTGFHRNMKIEYRGKICFLLGVDFDSKSLLFSAIDPESDLYIEEEDKISASYFECEIIEDEQL